MITRIVEKEDVVMPIEEWLEAVNGTAFIDYDGYGYFSDGIIVDTMTNIYPSMFYGRQEIPTKWTHIVWFNR